jgi:hypothetical protein
MPSPKSRGGAVTQSNGHSGRSRAISVRIDAPLLRQVMKLAGATSGDIAEATGKSSGYVRQVRLGKRVRVPAEFAIRAGDELARRLSRPGRLAWKLVLQEDE